MVIINSEIIVATATPYAPHKIPNIILDKTIDTALISKAMLYSFKCPLATKTCIPNKLFVILKSNQHTKGTNNK